MDRGAGAAGEGEEEVGFAFAAPVEAVAGHARARQDSFG